ADDRKLGGTAAAAKTAATAPVETTAEVAIATTKAAAVATRIAAALGRPTVLRIRRRVGRFRRFGAGKLPAHCFPFRTLGVGEHLRQLRAVIRKQRAFIARAGLVQTLFATANQIG